MKFNRIVLIGLLFSTGILNAQTDFKPGYIINVIGDTLYGSIDYRGDIQMSTVCKFIDSDNVIHDYYPNDILAYRFIDSKYYVSREVNNRQLFLEYLIKGKVNIYYMRDEKGDHYYIDKENIKLLEIPYEEGINYVNNKPYHFSSTKHFGILYLYMQDAPDFQERIQKIDKPQRRNLIKLAEDYQNAVGEGEKCIIYEEQQLSIKIYPEILGGIISFNSDDLKSKYFLNSGIIMHLWLPRVNEKIYLRTGLLYSVVKSNNDKQSIFKIPIQLEYIYPKSRIRPKIAFGINIYSPFYQSVGLLGGLNIKLYKSVYWSINCDMDFNPNDKIPLIPKSMLSYSILAGIYIAL